MGTEREILSVLPHVFPQRSAAWEPAARSSAFSKLSRRHFSPRIPGVVDCVSQLFREQDLTGLETVEVHVSEAIAAARRIIASGFPVGPGSGLNFCAAAKMARRPGPAANVVTVFPDRVERYFSTELFLAM